MTDHPKLPNQALEDLSQLVEELERRKHYNKIQYVFPESGPLSREHYPTQMAFFKAGKDHKERALIAGNRTGKTFTAMTEAVYHLTGDYPSWWEGYRYQHPILAWCIGKTNESTKEILQMELIGSYMDKGAGLIPRSEILSTTNRPGVPEAIQTVRVKHKTNGVEDGFSELVFKSYDQGRDALQGTAINLVCLDEEPKDSEIYYECLTRTLKCRACSNENCKGRIIATFTPFFGLSKIVRDFLVGNKFPVDHVHPQTKKWVAQLCLEDVPHVSEQDKADYINSIPPHMRNIRLHGIPSIGAGAIYPLAEMDITCEPFPIPAHWPRAYALDVGWHKTAALWAAQNPDDNVWYIYSEHYVGRDEPPLHAQAIRSRGAWIPGVIDPASNRSRDDGTQLWRQYLDLGLDLQLAKNAVDAGISLVWQMLSTGQLKVFHTCTNWFMEFRTYHKDEKGTIPDNQEDHLMDATRYLVMSGFRIAMTNPECDDFGDYTNNYGYEDPTLKGASSVTGY